MIASFELDQHGLDRVCERAALGEGVGGTGELGLQYLLSAELGALHLDHRCRNRGVC